MTGMEVIAKARVPIIKLRFHNLQVGREKGREGGSSCGMAYSYSPPSSLGGHLLLLRFRSQVRSLHVGADGGLAPPPAPHPRLQVLPGKEGGRDGGTEGRREKGSETKEPTSFVQDRNRSCACLIILITPSIRPSLPPSLPPLRPSGS